MRVTEYAVQSGDGFFIRFEGPLSPFMTSDPASASRGSRGEAENVIGQLEAIGFSANLVEVRLGKIDQ